MTGGSGFHQLRAGIAQMGQLAAGQWAPPKFGSVTSYDPDAYAVKVRLEPEGIETGWIVIKTLMAGVEFGAYFGPTIGDQAVILYQEGDINSGFCVGFLPSDEDRPPRVESGEIHLVAKDKLASVIMKPSGDILSKGAWKHEGPMEISETLKVSETIEAGDDITSTGGELTDSSGVTVKELRESYNSHRHPGVQSGGSLTQATNDPAQ